MSALEKILESWKTTLAGVFLVIAGLNVGAHGDKTVASALVAGGLGLICSKDYNAKDKQAEPPSEGGSHI